MSDANSNDGENPAKSIETPQLSPKSIRNDGEKSTKDDK